MEFVQYIAIGAAILALFVALIKAAQINKAPVGTDRMKEISAAINQGAKAFLFFRDYKQKRLMHSITSECVNLLKLI